MSPFAVHGTRQNAVALRDTAGHYIGLTPLHPRRLIAQKFPRRATPRVGKARRGSTSAAPDIQQI